jgi:hypothetical protein
VPVIRRKENGEEVCRLPVFISADRMGISYILVLTALIFTSALARKYTYCCSWQCLCLPVEPVKLYVKITEIPFSSPRFYNLQVVIHLTDGSRDYVKPLE